ncbi:MAG: ABC transporter permease [Acidobacteriaceae bacterium]|nr:ABC transporter permease [Acidobacteriaceae bacterium]
MHEMFRVLRARIKAFLKRRQLERDLDEEIAFHLAEKRQELEEVGMAAQEVAMTAKRQFGNASLAKERSREAWIFGSVENTMRDVKYAVRVLRKAPAFSVIALLTLAFGIGANTAIFSVVRSVVLQALPYQEPGQLYKIQEVAHDGAKRFPLTCVAAGNFLLWTRHASSVGDLSLLMPSTDYLNLKDETVEITGVRASANLFRVLGIQPWIGHSFSTDEDYMGKGRSVILTYSLWKRLFQSDSGIVGRTIDLNGFPFVVNGVLPESFYFPRQNELYGTNIAGWTHSIEYFVNLALQPNEVRPGMQMFNFAVIGRLRPGISPNRANEQLDVAEAQVPTGGLTGVKMEVELHPLRAAIVGDAERKLWMVMASAAVVLLLVCVNLAGLLIAKGVGRVHEIGVRAALGASRLAIVRQFLIEALTISAGGGALGVVAAYWGVRVLVRAAPVEIPRLPSIAIDGRVLLFSAAITVSAAVLFSLVPAFWLSRRSSAGMVRAAGPTTTVDRAISRIHQAVAAIEIAFCTVLLVSAILLAQSLVRVLRANAWGNVSHVLTLGFSAPPSHYQDASRRVQLITDVIESARNVPTVEAAGITTALPFTGQAWGNDVDFKEAPQTAKDRPNADWRFVSPDYFRAAGMALISGRFLTRSDYGHPLILISQRLANALPRGVHAVGAHVYWTPPDAKAPVLYEVIGVVADVRAMPEEQAPYMMYVPYWVWPPWGISLVVRTNVDARGVAASLQQIIRRTDNQIAIPHVESLRDILNQSTAARRFITSLGLLFALSATLLAAIGLYGLLSLSASQRTREIGVRMALGAQTNEIFRMFLLEATALAIAGLGCGLACAWAVTRLLRGFLYEVKPTDLGTFVSVCAGLLAVAAVASYAPARRAARVDPVTALKWD